MITQATNADLTAISAIENESADENTYGDDLLRLLLGGTYIAREQGNVVGFVSAWMMNATNIKKEKRGFKNRTKVPRGVNGVKLSSILTFVNIKVTHTRVGQGIGKKLVRHVLAKRSSHHWITYEYDATSYASDRVHVIEACLTQHCYDHDSAQDVHFEYGTANKQGLRVYFKKRETQGKGELSPMAMTPPSPVDDALASPLKIFGETGIIEATRGAAPQPMDAVREMLMGCRLEQYADAFDEQGYDDLPYLLELDEDGLRKVASTVQMKPGHAAKFVTLVLKLPYTMDADDNADDNAASSFS